MVSEAIGKCMKFSMLSMSHTPHRDKISKQALLAIPLVMIIPSDQLRHKISYNQA